MKWISVKDRFPKEYKNVLVLTEYGNMIVCWGYITLDGYFEWSTAITITHWRKLPNRPNKEK